MSVKFASVAIVAAMGLAASFGAQGAPAQESASLADQLKTTYKLAKYGLDSSGWSITEPGTVLVIQKGGILGVPNKNLTMAPATFRNGELHGPKGSALFVGTDTKQLPIGEKIYIIKMDVHPKNDKIALTIVECDSCNGAQAGSFYKSYVVFEFPKDYLSKADASQVADTIGQVFALESNDQQQTSQPQQQAPAQQLKTNAQQAPSTQAASATISIGQTIDQVVAIQGQPITKANVGAKQIYVYKDLKITFVDGKVTDIQ